MRWNYSIVRTVEFVERKKTFLSIFFIRRRHYELNFCKTSLLLLRASSSRNKMFQLNEENEEDVSNGSFKVLHLW